MILSPRRVRSRRSVSLWWLPMSRKSEDKMQEGVEYLFVGGSFGDTIAFFQKKLPGKFEIP